MPDTERYRYDPASNLLDEGQFRQRHNRVMHYQGIDYRYDTFGRTVEKRKGHYRWQYRYDAEHRLCEVVRYSLHRSEPQQHVQFRYDPLGRRTQKQVWLQSQDLRQPGGKRQITTFLWEGFRLLQETRDGMPLTYVYADQGSYEPLARIDGGPQAQVFYFHTAPNGEPESLTDSDGTLRWQGHSSAWGKTKYEENQQHLDYSQNLRLQGQYLDRETGLHYNLFRYYDPDIGRFTQHDPIGLAGGINLYQYAPNPLGWVDPLGLSKCSTGKSLSVNKPKILSSSNLTDTERKYLERQFMKKQNSLNRAAQRGELVWSPGTHDVRISSVQSSYRQAVSSRYEKMFGKPADLTKLNADHPVDLIVGGSPTQRLQMLNESINKSVGSSLKNAGRKAGLQPGDRISEIIFN